MLTVPFILLTLTSCVQVMSAICLCLISLWSGILAPKFSPKPQCQCAIHLWKVHMLPFNMYTFPQTIILSYLSQRIHSPSWPGHTQSYWAQLSLTGWPWHEDFGCTSPCGCRQNIKLLGFLSLYAKVPSILKMSNVILFIPLKQCSHVTSEFKQHTVKRITLHFWPPYLCFLNSLETNKLFITQCTSLNTFSPLLYRVFRIEFLNTYSGTIYLN